MLDYKPFIDFLQFEKRSSINTITAYSNDLLQFSEYMEGILNIHTLKDITSNDVRTWIFTLLEDDKCSTRTVNRKISTLKAFYRYASKVNLVSNNPMMQIHTAKTPKRLPEYVDQKDMEKLFSEELFEDNFEGLRDRTILELFYATGMRLSELLNIKVQDIDLHTNTIKILGKRNKERVIPFGNMLGELLENYLENYQEKFAFEKENNFIFVAANGNKLYPKAVYRIVRKYLSMVTTITKKSPHVIRHTFATHLLNNGADLNAIKEILGHSSLAATQVYTHNSIEQLKSIYKQAHPRA